MEHVHVCDCVAIPVRIKVLGWVAGIGWSREFSLAACPGLCPKLPRLHLVAPRILKSSQGRSHIDVEFALVRYWKVNSDTGCGVRSAQIQIERIAKLFDTH